MRIRRHLLVIPFVALYGSLLLLAGIAGHTAKTWNSPDGGNGNGFNPQYSEEAYPPPGNLPLLFSHNAYLALARQAAFDGNMEDAKHYMFNAFQTNPASGEAAFQLFNLYTRPDLYKAPPEMSEEHNDGTLAEPAPPHEPAFIPVPAEQQHLVDKLIRINRLLRPTYDTTQATLAEYWLDRGQPENAVYGWHVLLTTYPFVAESIFPLIQTHISNPKVLATLKGYLDSPPSWWDNYFNYLLEHEVAPPIVQEIYAARLNAKVPLSTSEQDSYARYLHQHHLAQQ